uniref:Uncharacterized protein n=1 Tax=Syphacia muris TaxID=451379 RepID=A0A0N5AGZ9_9BILA
MSRDCLRDIEFWIYKFLIISDLTCNETMSVIDDAEAKDSQRFFQGQNAVSSRVPIAPAVTTQISRPVLKTLRGQPTSHIINSASVMSQKAHLLSSVVNAQIQPSTSQFNRSSTPKLISTRTSSTVPSNTIFKPFHSSVDSSVIVSDELSQPMAVIYRQFQQQQQLQQQQQQLRLTVNQPQSTFSFPRSRDYDPRALGGAAQTISQDARYFNSLNRLRPIVSNRNSNSSQQVISVPAVANTLRLTPQTRAFIDMAEGTEPCRKSSGRLINVADTVNSHETEIVGLSKRDKQLVTPSVCFSTSGATCDPSTSSVANALPVAATSSTCTSSQISNTHQSPHPGPSPRPSILRKIRDTSPSAAVRRLAFDGPPRPASCSDSQILPSSLNEDTSSSLARYIMNSTGRASGFVPQIDSISRVLSSSDPNVRNAQMNAFTNATAMSKSAFERVEGSQQQVNEPDTPRKRMRKQQFDSSQGPEKIKMEVSMQVDTNSIGIQSNDIPLWKLAPPGQPNQPSMVSKGSERSGRRRGRPRTSSRVDSSVIASTSYVDVDSVSTEGCKPKKMKRHQAHNTSELNLSENINPAANSSAIDISGLKTTYPSEFANICDASSNGNGANSLRNLLQNFQDNRDEGAKFLSTQKTTSVVLLSALGMTKAETKMSTAAETALRSGVAESNKKSVVYNAVSRAEEIQDSLSTDSSEYISSLSPIELGYSSPTILASLANGSKQESVLPNNHYSTNSCYGNIEQHRPRLLLNTLGNSRSVRFNHFEKIESVKVANQRVGMLKAARNRLHEQQRLDIERKIKERIQLKAFLLEKCRQLSKEQLQNDFSEEDCSSFKKLANVTSEALELSTAEFFDELLDVYAKQPEFLRLCKKDPSSKINNENLTSPDPNPVTNGMEAKLPEIVDNSCSHNSYMPKNNLSKPNFGSVRTTYPTVEPRNWKAEIAAIADLLDEVVTKVAATVSASTSSSSINQNMSSRNSDSLVQTSNGTGDAANKQIKKEESREVSSGNLKWYPSDELWDDYIYKELEKVEEALEVLEEDNELEDVGDRGMSKISKREEECGELKVENENEVVVRLAFRRIITTFDALRRAGINENDDIVELLYLLLDFVKILDPKGYEQLSEGFDLLYDASDTKEMQEKKRLSLVETFAMQIPRAHSTLKKATPYVASASTNFKPSVTLIDDLFEIPHPPVQKSWSSIDKSSFAISYKVENGKETPVFKMYSGDFNIDAELDGTEPDYLPSLLKDHYERETGSLAFRLRLEPRTNEKITQDDTFPNVGEMDNSFDRRKTEGADTACIAKESREFSTAGNAGQANTSGSNRLDFDDELLPTHNFDNENWHVSGHFSAKSDDKKRGGLRLKNLTNADLAHIRSRMRNIREQYASLLQTLHTNAMLASTAFEIFNDHSDELLADILPSVRTTESDASDVNSEHSTNDEDIRESVETPVSLSLPPSP